mgnify:CR=1 FL=1
MLMMAKKIIMTLSSNTTDTVEYHMHSSWVLDAQSRFRKNDWREWISRTCDTITNVVQEKLLTHCSLVYFEIILIEKILGTSRQEKSCQLSQLPSTIHSRCWVCSSGNRLCLVVDLLALGVFGKSTRWPNLPMVVSGQFVSGFAQGCAKLLA